MRVSSFSNTCDEALVFLTRTNRNLWPLIIAHGTIDSVALTMTWLANR